MTKKIKIEPKTLFVWIIVVVATLLLSFAKISKYALTLAVSLFVGLAYSRKNILILTPILLLSMVLANPVWQTVVVAITPAVVFVTAYLVTRKLKKKIKPLTAVLLTSASLLPTFFIYGLTVENTVYALVNLVLTALFTYCCINVCYLFFVKGLKYKLIGKEQISLWAFLFALSLGLYRLQYKSIYFSAVFFAFFVCFSVFFYAEKGAISSVICALACVFADMRVNAFVFCVIGVLSVLFAKKYRRILFLLMPSIDLIMGLGLGLLENYSYINAILLFAGGIAFSVLPDSIINKYLSNIGVERGYAVRTLVNRNRYDIYKRLDKVSGVLKEMGSILSFDDEGLNEPVENVKYLANKLAFSVCGDCPKRTECEKMLTADTSTTTYDLINNVIAAGRVSILEMPAFLVEYCIKSAKMVSACKEMMDNYTVKKELTDSVNACKTLMSEQINGLSGMIDGFAKEIKQTVSFDSTKERELVESLSAVNVIASEAVIYGERERKNLVLTVREQDESKPALLKTINKIMGNMIRTDKTKGKGIVNLTYETAPRFNLMHGVSSVPKTEGASGDTYSIVNISPDKVMFAICDGMGSGKKASEVSDRAISLVETFYKAGLDESNVLSIINKLLSSKGGEDFSALDICVVNLRNGNCDFIKLGGVESVIARKNDYEIVEGGALPIGILETVKPCVSRRNVGNGDMIVMFSDGITDSIGSDGVIRISEQSKTNNPETLANEIIEDSCFVGRNDDKTVLCVKIFNRI